MVIQKRLEEIYIFIDAYTVMLLSLLDLSNVTFEKVFNPIEDLNVPFETGYCTIRQLGLVKPRLFGKLYSKVILNFSHVQSIERI